MSWIIALQQTGMDYMGTHNNTHVIQPCTLQCDSPGRCIEVTAEKTIRLSRVVSLHSSDTDNLLCFKKLPSHTADRRKTSSSLGSCVLFTNYVGTWQDTLTF